MKKLLLIFQILIVGLVVAAWSWLGYTNWTRRQNQKRPCIVYRAGMTLEPGQCMVMELKAVPR